MRKPVSLNNQRSWFFTGKQGHILNPKEMKVKLQAMRENSCLNIESEVHDVAILHHVLAAFKAEFTGLFDGIF